MLRCLVEIKKGKTMLDWLLNEYLPKKSKVILATGHLHQIIFDYIKQKSYSQEILFSQEIKRTRFRTQAKNLGKL